MKTVVLSACLLILLSIGFRAGFGLFLQPMSEARGWGRDVLSLALAIQNLAWGVIAVFAGGLADRYGNLKVLLTGVVCYAVAMWCMAHATTELEIIATAGVLVGAGIAGTSFGIVLPAMARAVPKERRGQVLGIVTAAGSFGQFLVVPAMQGLIELSGWFYALHYLGFAAFFMALFALPLSSFSGTADNSGPELDASLVEILFRALWVRSFVLLVIGFFVCGFHVAFITVHMPSFLVDLGLSPRVGGWSIGMIGFCNIFGAYFSGVESSRRPKQRILVFIYCGRVVVIGVFLLMPITLIGVLVFSALMGFLWLATVPPTSGLVAVFFGTRYMTFLYGIVFLSHQIGGFCGVWMGGWVYETFGNYNGIWIVGMILGGAAALLHWPIREQDYTARLKEAA